MAGSPQQHEGIQFAGIGSTTNNNSVPPVTSWFFRFRVVDGPVSHVKIPTLGYQVAPRLEIPRMTSKFYRAFEHKITIEKEIDEMPDALENREGLQIPRLRPPSTIPTIFGLNIHLLSADRKQNGLRTINIWSQAHSREPNLRCKYQWEICQVLGHEFNRVQGA